MAATLLAVTAKPVWASESRFCLSGICVDQLLSEVDQAWEPRPDLLLGPRFYPRLTQSFTREFPSLTKEEIQSLLQRVENFGSIRLYDSKTEAILERTTRICGLRDAVGSFKSASGHHTTVVFSPSIEEDGSNRYRIAFIIREFSGVFSYQRDGQELVAEFRRTYGPVTDRSETLPTWRGNTAAYYDSDPTGITLTLASTKFGFGYADDKSAYDERLQGQEACPKIRLE